MPSQLLYDIAIRRNINNLARDIIFPVVTTGAGLHDFTTSNLHPPAVGLDISVINQDTITHTITLDGIQIQVAANSAMSLQNIPFITMGWDGANLIIKAAAASEVVLR